MITAANLHRSYSIGKKSIEILHGVNLHIAAGEKVFLCGPSGAGKTTLMYTLAGTGNAPGGESDDQRHGYLFPVRHGALHFPQQEPWGSFSRIIC